MKKCRKIDIKKRAKANLKKCLYILLICLAILPTAFVFIGCHSEEKMSSYVLDCVYDDEQKTLLGKEEVDYVNNSNNLLKEVKFHLYPNAFRQGAKASVVSSANFGRAFPNGQSFGGIEISSVATNDEIESFEIGGDDQNILSVKLTSGIYPDEHIKIRLDFVVTLPNAHHRFGYGENTINFGNFYPIACVYQEGKGYVTDLYHSNGDPFYSDAANYQMNLTYPDKFTLASSGQVKKTERDGTTKTSHIVGQKIRDFAFVLSDKFECASQSVDGITVNYFYYDDENFSASLNVGSLAIKTFNNLFGAYPYPSVNVVKSNFVHGGMEYPNMVLISDAQMSKDNFEYVIVHELAHQWWYGVVGNNQYASAWQDEGLTEYSTALFYENNEQFGITYDEIIDSNSVSYKSHVGIHQMYQDDYDTSMNRRLDQFKTESEYVNFTYTKGVLMFDTFRQAVGNKKFFKALKSYYQTFKFKNASAEDFVRCMMDTCGAELEAFFEDWLCGYVKIF